MIGCHVVTRDEITKLEEFTTSSAEPQQPVARMETVDFLLCQKIYIFLKRQVSQKRPEKEGLAASL